MTKKRELKRRLEELEEAKSSGWDGSIVIRHHSAEAGTLEEPSRVDHYNAISDDLDAPVTVWRAIPTDEIDVDAATEGDAE